MAHLAPLFLALIAGLVLALFYFQGLWFTVRRMPDLDNPLRATMISFAVRLSFALIGFYLVMGTHPERLVAALCGFLLMREILIRRRMKELSTFPKGAACGNRSH
jgi:F1F0 ATPase subunit 2